MRLSKALVYEAIENAAKTINAAGKGDGRTSRAEMTAALAKVSDTTERALTDIFFRFIDKRDAKSGASVTPQDLLKAVAYAKETLIAKYDLNNNGLTETEVAKMSRTGKLAVEWALLKKQGSLTPTPIVDDSVAMTFRAYKALPAAEKLAMMESYGNTPDSWKRSEAADPALLPKADRAFAKRMVAQAKQDIDFDLDPDPFATVGAPVFNVEVVRLPSGEIAGGNLYIRQKGVEIFDVADAESHYDTVDEAEAAGATVSDVEWSAYAVFDEAGKPLMHTDYLEWSGY